jgi:hypothetical protein
MLSLGGETLQRCDPGAAKCDRYLERVLLVNSFFQPSGNVARVVQRQALAVQFGWGGLYNSPDSHGREDVAMIDQSIRLLREVILDEYLVHHPRQRLRADGELGDEQRVRRSSASWLDETRSVPWRRSDAASLPILEQEGICQ